MIRDHNPQSALIRSGDFQKTVFVQGDLEDLCSVERAINEYEIDSVFHLGAQTIVGTAWKNPLGTFETNIRGTYHLLEACRRYPERIKNIVIASSDKAYGTSDVLPYTEEMPLCGRHPYDVSKSCADMIASAYFHSYKLPIAIVRCGNIYGGGDLNWSRLIPGTIRSLLSGQRPMIRSNGNLTRDYLFVEDAVESYLLLAENMDKSEVLGNSFNFGPNHPYSVLEIVRCLQVLLRRTDLIPDVLNIANSEIENQSLSSKKAKDLLGWMPRFSLEDGLKKTVSWYEKYLGGSVPLERISSAGSVCGVCGS